MGLHAQVGFSNDPLFQCLFILTKFLTIPNLQVSCFVYRMTTSLEKFKTDSWFEFVDELEQTMKTELHGGIIKSYRDSFENERAEQLRTLRENFCRNVNIEIIDEQLNEYTSSIKKINASVQHFINYDLINYLYDNSRSFEILYPETTNVVRYIFENQSRRPDTARLQGLFNKVVFESTNQSNKSNAGKAGEEFVEVMLNAIGLEHGKHYKKQHKSKSYTDTDFVFPYVEHNRDVEVEMYAAVQFSSNDRVRMVGGELKSGANAVAISGNGFAASSKNLDAIGAKILSGMMEKNHRLVCYGAEIQRKVDALKTQLSRRKVDGSPHKGAADQQVKLDFYENYAVSFSDFAKELQRRFL